MTDEDSRKRRLVRHTACFTPVENALFMTKVDVAGVSISTFLKSAALDFPLPRGARRPSVDHKATAQLLATMGRTADAFRDAAHLADPRLAETAINDLNECRIIIFEALGRKP